MAQIYACTQPVAKGSRETWVRAISVSDMQRYLRELTEFLQDKHGDILKDIRENFKAKVDDKMRERLDKALTAFKGVFKPSAVSK